jgi:hypothetical protein
MIIRHLLYRQNLVRAPHEGDVGSSIGDALRDARYPLNAAAYCLNMLKTE